MTDDYLRFIENLDYYLSIELEFVNLKDSRHYSLWEKDKSLMNVPIGKLDDVEIVFLHYKDPLKAKAKWERRVSRINRENLIFKFSYMNNCHEEDIEKFINLKLPGKKLCFVKDKKTASKDNCLVYYKGFEDSDQIYNDTYYWNRYLNVEDFINKGIITPK